jgi:type IX secretion system PorP/SprF family membrane protein
MKRIILTILTISFALFAKNAVYSQDIHFSQFFSAPLFLNPSNTGDFEGDYRAALNNKNQWNTFTNAYSSFAGSIDAGFDDVFISQSRSGIGLQINNDIAGDGRFRTTQLYLNFAYQLNVDKTQKFRLGLGLAGGYVMHGINLNNLYFGNQYDGERFNENLPSDEVLINQKMSYPDFGTGAKLKYKYNHKLNFELGFSAYHLLQPKRSFIENSEMFLPIKYSTILFAEYQLKEDLFLEAHALHMVQQKHNEVDVGGIFRLDYNPLDLQSIYFGGLVRAKDAGIIVFGFKYHNFKICFNYDINFSKLSTISRGKGGAEFSIIYVFFKPRPFQAPDYKKCPDFI